LLGQAQLRLVRPEHGHRPQGARGAPAGDARNHREDVDQVGAGAIAAAVGLKQTTTGDTLCDPDAPVLLENIDFPDPVIDVAVEPKTKADQDKLAAALQRLAEEDPTFRVRTNEETGQTIIAGMGELHLEIIVDRLMRE